MSLSLETYVASEELDGESLLPDPNAVFMAQANDRLRGVSPEAIPAAVLDEAAAIEPKPYVLSSFGLQAALLFGRLRETGREFPVLFIDTGVEHAETLEYMETLRKLFHLNITVVRPDPTVLAQALERVRTEGYAAYEAEFNRLTKLEPLQRFLGENAVLGLITGIRASQTENRAAKSPIEPGKFGELRYNPHLYVTDEEAEALYEAWDLPQHPLKDFTLEDRLRNTIDDTPVKRECGLNVYSGGPKPTHA